MPKTEFRRERRIWGVNSVKNCRKIHKAGEGEDRVPRRSQVGDLGLVTGRAQPALRQQHDVAIVVLNEGGYVSTDLALKRQTRSVFSAEEEPRGM